MERDFLVGPASNNIMSGPSPLPLTSALRDVMKRERVPVTEPEHDVEQSFLGQLVQEEYALCPWWVLGCLGI